MCLYLHPPIVARQRLGKNITAVTNTNAIIEALIPGPKGVASQRVVNPE
jgi:hypothetical protein